MKILLVDDEEMIVKIISRRLEKEGYKVYYALNGIEALNILEKDKIDIVLTDIKMPEMDGVELLRKIKSEYLYIEVIMFTAYPEIETSVSCMKMGAFDYLIKPIDFDVLLLVVKRCIQEINLKKEGNLLQTENIELKRKLDFFEKEYDKLKQTPQQKLKEHPDSITLSEFGDMIAGITHSLTTEIGIISSTSEGLLDEKVADDRNIKKLGRLSRSAKYCNVLLNNLTSLLLEGKPSPTETDIRQVLDDVITLFEYRIPSNVKLITEFSHKLPKLIIDKGQFEQILVNTINNAIEAMPKGGRLSIKAKKKGTNLNIEVSDTGVGMPKENLDNVFELYFSTKKKGVGLGLYLTKRIVERHNGNVSIKSQEGKGTTLSINLPIGKDN